MIIEKSVHNWDLEKSAEYSFAPKQMITQN